MLSDPAARLLAELEALPGGKMCVACACQRLETDNHGVLKIMRELVANSHIIHGVFHCSACQGVALVAFLRPLPFNRFDR